MKAALFLLPSRTVGKWDRVVSASWLLTGGATCRSNRWDRKCARRVTKEQFYRKTPPLVLSRGPSC